MGEHLLTFFWPMHNDFSAICRLISTIKDFNTPENVYSWIIMIFPSMYFLYLYGNFWLPLWPMKEYGSILLFYDCCLWTNELFIEISILFLLTSEILSHYLKMHTQSTLLRAIICKSYQEISYNGQVLYNNFISEERFETNGE